MLEYFVPLPTAANALRALAADAGVSNESLAALILTEKDKGSGLPLFHMGLGLVEKEKEQEDAAENIMVFVRANPKLVAIGAHRPTDYEADAHSRDGRHMGQIPQNSRGIPAMGVRARCHDHIGE